MGHDETHGRRKAAGTRWEHDVIADDVNYLRDAGLLRELGSGADWLIFRVAPQGLKYYAQMKQASGEPLQRQEAEVQRFLNGKRSAQHTPERSRGGLRPRHSCGTPTASASSRRSATRRARRCRSSPQRSSSATSQPTRREPHSRKPRLGAVIAMFLPSLGDARATLLKALGDYSEATLGVIQRQEHGGQREGHQLTWQDARRVVFHTASGCMSSPSRLRTPSRSAVGTRSLPDCAPAL